MACHDACFYVTLISPDILLVGLCILVYMIHETNFMNPVLAMTHRLDVQLWVGLMEIKGPTK